MLTSTAALWTEWISDEMPNVTSLESRSSLVELFERGIADYLGD